MAARILRRRRLQYFCRIQRPLVDRLDPLAGLDDEDIRMRYRFSRETLFFITDLIRNRLERPTGQGSPLPAFLQLLITLRFLATGTFQSVVADLFQVHQTTVGRTVDRVCLALASLVGRYVTFPVGRAARLTQAGFHAIAGKCFHLLQCIHNSSKNQNPKQWIN